MQLKLHLKLLMKESNSQKLPANKLIRLVRNIDQLQGEVVLYTSLLVISAILTQCINIH